jgi:NAD(P)-dependent dehydrogenase (short-subunit alcohol dehydrogenase family)
MDVTSRADWAATMSAAQEKFGRCDILVNNAGWSYVNKATAEVTEEEFERVFDVNVKGVYLGCQAWVGQAIERGEGGVVINIASVGATRPRPGLVWYNASKGAVWNVCLLFVSLFFPTPFVWKSFLLGTKQTNELKKERKKARKTTDHSPLQATKGLAAEYGPHQIRVNSICPLVTATGLFSAFTGMEDTPANREKFTANVPMGRIGEVQDVVGACIFMASAEAGFITGVNLEVDGGRCV